MGKATLPILSPMPDNKVCYASINREIAPLVIKISSREQGSNEMNSRAV